MNRAMPGHGDANARVLGQIGDVDEPLSAVGVAILAQIVAQPWARKFAQCPVGPLDAEQVGDGPDALHGDLADHGGCLPSAADLALRKYSAPAPSAASALT